MSAIFTGKVALVTGAGSGIGRAAAATLAAGGANVVVTDIDEDRAKIVANELEHAHAMRCDVADSGDVQRAVSGAVERFGRLDILVQNAGIDITAPLIDTADDHFQRLLAINVAGAFHGIKYAAPQMATGGGGAIVSISSAAGLRGVPMMGAYAASKAAVINLTQTAALELRP